MTGWLWETFVRIVDGLLIKTMTIFLVLKNRTPFKRMEKKQVNLHTFSDSSVDGHLHNPGPLPLEMNPPIPTEQIALSFGQSVESLPPQRSGFKPRLVLWDVW